MSTKVNFKIGDSDAQKKFRKIHHDFIQGFPTLTTAIEKAFKRTVENTDLVDALVYDLSRECVNRFSEIGLLCANGVGDGAFIILRSMFEYLVTARYIHLHPDTANDFVDYLFVHIRTVRNQTERIFGSDYVTKEYKEIAEKNFARVKEKFTRYTKDGPRTKSRWADSGIVDMAINSGLGRYVILAYYFPIEKAHPSMLYLLSNQEQKDDATSQALMISHKMMIELLILQHEHFGLDELKPLISQCLHDFDETWEKYKNSDLP